MTDRQEFLMRSAYAVRSAVLEAERWLWKHPQTGYTNGKQMNI